MSALSVMTASVVCWDLGKAAACVCDVASGEQRALVAMLTAVMRAARGVTAGQLKRYLAKSTVNVPSSTHC
jgi:hypothetical protein